MSAHAATGVMEIDALPEMARPPIASIRVNDTEPTDMHMDTAMDDSMREEDGATSGNSILTGDSFPIGAPSFEAPNGAHGDSSRLSKCARHWHVAKAPLTSPVAPSFADWRARQSQPGRPDCGISSM